MWSFVNMNTVFFRSAPRFQCSIVYCELPTDFISLLENNPVWATYTLFIAEGFNFFGLWKLRMLFYFRASIFNAKPA